MKQRKCFVLRDELTAEEMLQMRNEQKNTGTLNERAGEESAFAKALRGSKLFLKAQGYLDEAEETK